MSKKEKKERHIEPSKAKALGLSFHTLLIASIVFAILYAYNLYDFVVTIIGILIAIAVFLHYCRPTWRSVFGAFIWCVLWSAILNIIATMFVESIFICEVKYNLFEAVGIYFNKLQNNLPTLSNLQKMVIEIVVLSLIFAFISVLIYANVKKIKITHAHTEEKVIDTTESTYFNLFISMKHILENYQLNKNKSQFASDIKIYKETYIKTMDKDTKVAISLKVENELKSSDIIKINEQTLKCLQKILSE